MEIQDIKAQLSILRVLAHYGLVVSPNNHLHCPFHKDKTPSMKVFRDTNTVYCFSGNCDHGGKSMDVLDYVMYMEGCSKHEAILRCKEILGWVAPAEGQPSILPRIWKDLQGSYQRSGSKVKSYVKSRGLEGIELGYNYGKWHLHPKRTDAENQRAMSAGFLRSPLKQGNKYGVWARGALMFALRDRMGAVVSLYGRSIEGGGHYYMKGGTRGGLYPKYPDVNCRKLILTESVIDAASLLRVSTVTERYEVLALYGTNSFSRDHRQALQGLKELEEVVLMLDGDEAGRKASQKIGQELLGLVPHASIRVAHLPEETDVNELWANHLSEALFVELLQTATTLHQSSQNKPLSTSFGPEQGSVLSSIEDKSQDKAPRLDVKKGLELEVLRDNLYTYEIEGIKFFVLGGIDLGGIADMRCTLKVKLVGGSAREQLRHTLNLFHHGQVKGLEKHLHEQLGVSHTIAKVALSELIEQLERYREEWQSSRQETPQSRPIKQSNRQAALAYLKGKDLMERTWDDLGKVGIVGERASALILYLCYSSRKLSEPLHTISFGTSGSGKTHLQEAVSSLIPEEEVIHVTSLSDRALYYYGKDKLRHKLFCLEDLDGISEEALYAVRELMSKGSLAREIPQQDRNGNREILRAEVEGPICFSGCTTKENLYEDNANRCLLLYRDESPAHKAKVMDYQRKAAAGRINKLEQKAMREAFKDQQTLLRPIKVVNPFAEALKLPEQVFKPLRSNDHYLRFIQVITFYHQFQRAIKVSQSGTEYIETTIEDIEWANRLMREVLLRKADHLTKGQRAFLEALKVWLRTEKKQSFTGKEYRKRHRIAPSTLKNYLNKLLYQGFIEVVAGHPRVGYEYALSELDDYDQVADAITQTLLGSLENIKKNN